MKAREKILIRLWFCIRAILVREEALYAGCVIGGIALVSLFSAARRTFLKSPKGLKKSAKKHRGNLAVQKL